MFPWVHVVYSLFKNCKCTECWDCKLHNFIQSIVIAYTNISSVLEWLSQWANICLIYSRKTFFRFHPKNGSEKVNVANYRLWSIFLSILNAKHIYIIVKINRICGFVSYMLDTRNNNFCYGLYMGFIFKFSFHPRKNIKKLSVLSVLFLKVFLLNLNAAFLVVNKCTKI